MDIPRLLEKEALADFQRLSRASSPEDALERTDNLKVLCALKRGSKGVQHINNYITSLVTGRPYSFKGYLYKGLPVIISRNDYMLELFNGDTGVIWPDESGRLKAWFPCGENGIRQFSPARLPSFEAAWAITVHRSQGSEFKRVLLVLPSEKSAMPGRELLYTAITRARDEITIWGTWDDLRACVERQTARTSGLGEILWQTPAG